MRFHLSLAALMLANSVALRADDLGIGSPAPRLEIGAFLKGEPVKELEKGTVYVIEFSGTKCAPCAKCIPLLNELQKKYKGVVFVSVYSEREAGVREYVGKLGEKIGFRVAVDDHGRTAKGWMEAAGMQGIPTAFVIDRNRRIAWIGYAAEHDFDVKAIFAELRKRQAALGERLVRPKRRVESAEAIDRIRRVADGRAVK